MQEWPYVAPTSSAWQPIASWKDEPTSAYRAAPARWVNVLLLFLTIVVIMVLSGIGLCELYQGNTQPSSDELSGGDAGSDAHLQVLLRAHRDAALRR